MSGAGNVRRRSVLRLVAASAASAALEGCTRPRPRPRPARDRPRFEGEGQLFFAAPPDFSLGEQRRTSVRKWNGEHPEAVVTYIELHPQADLQRAELLSSLQAGLPPGAGGYDVLGLDVVWTAEFARDGHILPLTSVADALDTDRFLPQVLESARYRGELWAVPVHSNAGLLYYRSDLIATPPTSWEELEAQASDAASRHGVDGYIGQLARYEGLTVNLAEAVWGQGGELVDREGSRVTAGQPTAAAGLAFLQRGLERGWIPRAALNWTEEDCRRRFQQRGAAFMRNWPYAYALLRASDSPVRDQFKVAPLPAARGTRGGPGPSALGGMNLAISTRSANRRAALEFIEFMAEDTTQKPVFEAGGYPSVLSAVYDDPEVRARQPYTPALRESMGAVRSRPVTPYYGQVTRVIQDAAWSALHDGRDPTDAMEQLAARLQDALEGR